MNEREEFEDEIDLIQIFEIVWNKLWLFAIICCLCCTAAFLFTRFMMEKQYTATSKMIIVQKSSTSSMVESFTYSDLQMSQKLANTYSEIIMSEAISEPVINNLNLYNDFGISTDDYKKIVKVSPVNNTEVIDVVATTNDPKLSADIANEVVEVFEEKIYDIMQIENVTTLTKAKIPQKKSGPSTIKNMMIGGIIGALICAAITLFTLLTDTKMKTEDEIKKIFDYPIIGRIPDFEVRDKNNEEDEADEPDTKQ